MRYLLALLILLMPATAGPSIAPSGVFRLTAYSGPQLHGQKIPITATGTIASSGRTIAVDPRIISLGTVVWIHNVGERVAEDVGATIKGRRIDIYMNSKREAKNFGVQRERVEVVKPARL